MHPFRNRNFKPLLSYLGIAALALSLYPNTARSDGTDGFGQIFNAIFGSEEARKKSKESQDSTKCDRDGADFGLIDAVNSIFCHLKNDMGINGVGSATKTFEQQKVRAEIAGAEGVGAYTIAGIAYDYQAKVWVCSTASSACTDVSQFGKVMNLTFSYKSDNTVNKGYLVMDPVPFSGGAAGSSGFSIVYDLGSAATTPSITAKVLFVQGSQTFKLRADGTKTAAGVLTATILFDQGGLGARVSARADTVANTGSIYAEFTGCSGTGCATLSTTAVSDTPTGYACFSRTKSARDFTYTIAGGSCTAPPAFPSQSLTTVRAYTATGILDADSVWTNIGSPTAL